ncbi:MAG TPA: NDP-sugar synthase, partial [bacterium]|nr:NDP-sugar synthase [bacterium]
PAEAKGDLVATCVYVFSPEIFSHLPKTPEKKHFGKEVFPRLLAEKHAVYAYEHTGYWNDIGNPNTYLMANFDTLTQKAKLEISLTEVEPRLYRGEDVYIAPSARIIPPVVIGDRVHIGDNCVIGPFAVIGRGVTIENNSQVERSLINDACHLEEDCLLWESILAKHCHVYKQNQVKNLVLGENSLINKTTL